MFASQGLPSGGSRTIRHTEAMSIAVLNPSNLSSGQEAGRNAPASTSSTPGDRPQTGRQLRYVSLPVEHHRAVAGLEGLQQSRADREIALRPCGIEFDPWLLIAASVAQELRVEARGLIERLRRVHLAQHAADAAGCLQCGNARRDALGLRHQRLQITRLAIGLRPRAQRFEWEVTRNIKPVHTFESYLLRQAETPTARLHCGRRAACRRDSARSCRAPLQPATRRRRMSA